MREKRILTERQIRTQRSRISTDTEPETAGQRQETEMPRRARKREVSGERTEETGGGRGAEDGERKRASRRTADFQPTKSRFIRLTRWKPG